MLQLGNFLTSLMSFRSTFVAVFGSVTCKARHRQLEISEQSDLIRRRLQHRVDSDWCQCFGLLGYNLHSGNVVRPTLAGSGTWPPRAPALLHDARGRESMSGRARLALEFSEVMAAWRICSRSARSSEVSETLKTGSKGHTRGRNEPTTFVSVKLPSPVKLTCPLHMGTCRLCLRGLRSLRPGRGSLKLGGDPMIP